MSFDPGQSGNPYRTPFDAGGYAPPPPGGGADVPMILGIISIVLGVMAVPLSFCCCFVGLAPGILAIGFGGVAIAMPPRPGSIGRYLGIGGVLMGLIPVLWIVVWSIFIAVSPRPENNNNNNPFQFNPPSFSEQNKAPPAVNAPPADSAPKDDTKANPGGGLFPPNDGGEIKLPDSPTTTPESSSPDSKPGP